MLSQIVRGFGVFVAFLFLCGPATAKYPEMDGPRQFDLFCQGQNERVLDAYIPVPMAGPGEIPEIEKVKAHLIIDLNTMRFLRVEAMPEFRKIAQEKDDLLYLYNWRGHNRWVINLSSYKSVAVSEDDSGELWVEKMQCRPAKFSGFAGAPSILDPAVVPRGSH